jgi:hypothetical protein
MRWLSKLPLVVVILLFSCIGSIAWNLISTRLSLSNIFCSTSNAVYQLLIQRSANEWYSQASSYDVQVFKTDTRMYYAKAYQHNKIASLVSVSVGTERDGLSGSEGFLYLLPDQTIPQYWFDNYWITHLSDNMYCYNIRGF